jgi:hypothetical protein
MKNKIDADTRRIPSQIAIFVSSPVPGEFPLFVFRVDEEDLVVFFVVFFVVFLAFSLA